MRGYAAKIELLASGGGHLRRIPLRRLFQQKLSNTATL
jgi:hypothetical protein